jgi:hypothetical protein
MNEPEEEEVGSAALRIRRRYLEDGTPGLVISIDDSKSVFLDRETLRELMRTMQLMWAMRAEDDDADDNA